MSKHKTKKKSKKYESKSEEWVEKQIKIPKQKRRKRHYSSSSSSSVESCNSKKKDKQKRSKRHYSSSSSSSDESCNSKKKEYSKDEYSKSETSDQQTNKREDWMTVPSSFYTTSTLDIRKEKEYQRKQEKEKSEYNPSKCGRELNPYWKDGGDGLPTFKKPSTSNSYYENDLRSGNAHKNKLWQKSKTDTAKIDKREIKETLEEITLKDTDQIQLTEKDLNVLAAKIVKAEIMGNTNLVNDLKVKLENARNSLNAGISHEEILLTHTDKEGRSMPVKSVSQDDDSHHKKKKRTETHRDGNRVKYFADDDKYSLKQMFESEKYHSVEDINKEFLNMTKNIRKNDDMDDIFSDNIRKEESDYTKTSKKRDKAIAQHNQFSKSLDNCNKCIQSEYMQKHLMISMGETVYLSLPAHEPLTEGHCVIVPIRHTKSSTTLDENEWTEIMNMRKALVNMFKSNDKDVIFFECATGFNNFNHMFIECVPLPNEDGDMAPIYFKKAIDECEVEWSHNKKLISLKGRDVIKAIPKGLPYFSVSFGMEEGYAHVIEDEQLFPKNFAQEIIGGMLDIHHSKWRKPKVQTFEEQSKRALHFSKIWKNYDPTL